MLSPDPDGRRAEGATHLCICRDARKLKANGPAGVPPADREGAGQKTWSEDPPLRSKAGLPTRIVIARAIFRHPHVSLRRPVATFRHPDATSRHPVASSRHPVATFRHPFTQQYHH